METEKKRATLCEECAFYVYDDEYGEYICDAELDEDELVRMMEGGRECPFYREGDEYKMVRHQI